MKIKQGFTLAEVVLTLGVVATIAAVLLPSLMNTKPNQEMMMLKKVYYLTGRMVNELINDEDFYPDDEEENKSGFSNVKAVRYHGHTYENNDKFCGLFAARMNVKGEIDCTEKPIFTAGQEPGDGNFTTADGIVWILPINDFDRGGADDSKQSIYVDVNGDKKNNCFSTDSNCSKPDRFEIKLDRWGKLYIEDEVTRKYLSNTDVTKQLEDIR